MPRPDSSSPLTPGGPPAPSTAFRLVGQWDGTVELAYGTSPADLVAALRSLADEVERQAALEARRYPDAPTFPEGAEDG